MIKVLSLKTKKKIARFIELSLNDRAKVRQTKALDGRTGAEEALTNDYDLILLDVWP